MDGPNTATMSQEEAVLRQLEYSHRWNFDVEHVVELFHVCQAHPGTTALEIGSYRGHCALAMALAGLAVISIDTSAEHLEARAQLIRDHRQSDFVAFLIESSDVELRLPRSFDIILHDNGRRGAKLLGELEAFWHQKLLPGGLLIVHNVEQIDVARLVRRLGAESHIVTTDSRKRQLGYFAKSVQPMMRGT
ncbi:MAG: class I SAM-dependent methyltransferase [Thermomicrobiales bacterium]